MMVMNEQIAQYLEPLEAEELAFLQKKEEKDRRQFYKVVKVLMVLCFTVPYIIGWLRYWAKIKNPFSYLFYFGSVAFLLFFTTLVCYISYYYYLRKVQSDIRSNTKIIERTHITRKHFMPLNNTFHFYLDSPNQLSIEVDENDYRMMKEGDEVNIEYTGVSKMYLGYF